MSEQVKKQFGSGCLLTLQDNKVILTNSSHQHIVFALGDLQALVRLWNEHDPSMLESNTEVIHLCTTLDRLGIVNTACGLKKTSVPNLRWTKNIRWCTCPACIEALVDD